MAAADGPKVFNKSHTTCSVQGKLRLYLEGQFPADACVVFQENEAGEGWTATVERWIDGPDRQVLVCIVPPYGDQGITDPKKVKLKVVSAGQYSAPHNFTYTPKLGYDFTIIVDKHQLTKKEFKQGLESLVFPFGHGVPRNKNFYHMINTVEKLAQMVVFRVTDEGQKIDSRNSISVTAYTERGLFADVPVDQNGRVASPGAAAEETKELFDFCHYINKSYHECQIQVYEALGILEEARNLTDSHVQLCNLLDRQTESMLDGVTNHIVELGETRDAELGEIQELVLKVVMLRFMADCIHANNLCKTTGDGYGAWERHTRVLMSFAAIWLILDALKSLDSDDSVN